MKKWLVNDKDTNEDASPYFETKHDAEVWCEENGVDYDYYEIIEVDV